MFVPVHGFEGYYEIDISGNVRSVNRTITGGRWGKEVRKGLPIKHKHMLTGHVMVKLHKDGIRHTCHLGSLLLEAFESKRPEGMFCCHNNGDASDNSLSNLRWDTPKSNSADAIKHGTQVKGEKVWSSTLKEGEVSLIKSLIHNNISRKIVEKMFKISRHVYNGIKTNRTWKFI